ncbi:hypothetical protein BGZ76_011553 [Entomortierella beljakovae]|nr:hypothetical protein BGZ76_011553 [Entomortierella beljakovae]
MSITFFAVDPQYNDGSELALDSTATCTSNVIWRLVASSETPKGLYLPIDKSLVVDTFSILFPQLSSNSKTGPTLSRIETCLANPETFTLFLATETVEIVHPPVVLTQPTQQQEQQQEQEQSDIIPTFTIPQRVSCKITKVIGCLTLITLNLLMNTRAHIEDLVVLDDCRGQGIGRGLMKRALNEAVHVRNCKMVDLTSKPDRHQARSLYESLGFQIRDTGAFRFYAPTN